MTMVKKRLKKIQLDDIPEIVEKAVALIDREITILAEKEFLNLEESKNLVSYIGVLTNVQKDYRAEIKQIKEDMKGLSKETLMQMVKSENN